jgi:hypothetical protein
MNIRGTLSWWRGRGTGAGNALDGFGDRGRAGRAGRVGRVRPRVQRVALAPFAAVSLRAAQLNSSGVGDQHGEHRVPDAGHRLHRQPAKSGSRIRKAAASGFAASAATSTPRVRRRHCSSRSVARRRGTLNCNASSTNLKFTGVQAGTDMARLNWNGWNVHLWRDGRLSQRDGAGYDGGFAGAGLRQRYAAHGARGAVRRRLRGGHLRRLLRGWPAALGFLSRASERSDRQQAAF